MAGLVLGLFALGNLLGGYWLPLRWILGFLAFSLYVLLIAGILHHQKEAKEQLQQPLVASVFPTFFMSGMLLSTYLQQLLDWTLLASGLWCLAFLGNVGLIVYFFLRFTWRFR